MEDFKMKTRKMVLMFLLVGCLVAAFAVTSYAASATYTCRVKSAGSTTWDAQGKTYKTAITLEYASGAPAPTVTIKTFYAPKGKERDFLAIALTAIANSKLVTALVDFQNDAAVSVNNLFIAP
jgi:hypothetical protein